MQHVFTQKPCLQQVYNPRLLSVPLPAMSAPPAVTRFILIEPSHAGNVGAVARAMKVMGFYDLVLVRLRWLDVLTRPEAVERNPSHGGLTLPKDKAASH